MSAISQNLSIPQINLSVEEKKEFSDYKKRMKTILKQFNDIKGEVEPVYMGFYNCTISDAESFRRNVSREAKRFVQMFETASSDASVHLETFLRLKIKIKGEIIILSEQRDDFFKQVNPCMPKIEYQDLVFSWQEKLIHLDEIIHAILDRSEKAANGIDYLRALENSERIKIFGIWVKPTPRTQRYYTTTLLAQLTAGNILSTQHCENIIESQKSVENETPLKTLSKIKEELFKELSLFNSVRNDADVVSNVVMRVPPSQEKDKFSVNFQTLSEKIQDKLESKLTNVLDRKLYGWIKGIKEAEKYTQTLQNNQCEYQEALIELSIAGQALTSLITRCERAAKAVERLQSIHRSQYSWFNQIVLTNSMLKDGVNTKPERAYTSGKLAEITAQVNATLSD